MKVIFDTDPGIDDAMALLYLNAAPHLNLIGITTILGNASIEQVTTNACILCDCFNITAPVFKGAAQSLDGSAGDYPDFVHGRDGLGDVGNPAPTSKASTESAVDYLLRITSEHPGEVTIIAVGRLTNLGLALQQDPAFAERVERIVLMGGSVSHEGNVTPWAEANIIGDPEAAHLVFQSGIPVTMVGLDVTMRTQMTDEYLKDLTSQLGALGDFLSAINKPYARYYMDRFGLSSIPIHDSSAVAYADEPALFTVKRGLIECELNGEQRGRTLFTEGIEGPHQVCLLVKSDEMLTRYRKTVLKHYV